MARTSAISITTALNAATSLAEIYGIVIESVQKGALSTALKSQNFSGNPMAGSVEFKRFVNSQSKPYGTARTNLKGDKLQADPVTVNLSTHREIVEEFAKFDLDTYGVTGLVKRRAVNHVKSMIRELDKSFITALCTAATETNTDAATPLARLESLILDLETVENGYVDGVPRDMIDVICSPAFYSAVRSGLDEKPNPNVDTAGEDFGIYHGVRVYSNLYIAAGLDAIAAVREAAAQPVIVTEYPEAAKIQQSNDFSTELFYDYGTKVLTEDLVFKLSTAPSALGELDVTSAAGTGENNTILTIDPSTAGAGFKFVYKLGASYTSFDYDDTLTTGWTELESGDTVAASTSTKVTVAKVTTAGKARSRGIAVLVKASA